MAGKERESFDQSGSEPSAAFRDHEEGSPLRTVIEPVP